MASALADIFETNPLQRRDDILALSGVAPSRALLQGMSLVAACCALIVGALFLVVAIDVPWQLWSYHNKLKMSREDLRQEHKESEGDPHVKGRIRQQQRAAARRRMMAEVPRADVVVTNPTHYAVALKYQEGQAGAPGDRPVTHRFESTLAEQLGGSAHQRIPSTFSLGSNCCSHG